MSKSFTFEERFNQKYEVDFWTGCWNWTGALHKNGYGVFGGPNRTTWRAHRFSFVMVNGDIPPKMDICHKCDNRKCVNPEHLFVGTRKDNMQDCVSKNRLKPGWVPGVKNGNSVINDDIVRLIRSDNRTCTELGRIYGISWSMVSRIKHRKAWQHVE